MYCCWLQVLLLQIWPSQHSLTLLCQWDDAIKRAGRIWLKTDRNVCTSSPHSSLHHRNLHLLCVECEMNVLSLCLHVKSLFSPTAPTASKVRASDRRCWRIKATAGWGFYSLPHLWCSVSFTHLYLQPVNGSVAQSGHYLTGNRERLLSQPQDRFDKRG